MNNQDIHITLEEWEQIESYLNGSLAANEAAIFREQLDKDNTLAAKVEQVKLSLLTVEAAGLRADLESFHQRLQTKPVVAIDARKKSSIKKWLAIAAVFVAIFVTALLWLQQPSKDEKLFTTFYKPDPGLSTTMSQTDDYTFEKAMVEYKTGNYAKALKEWRILLDSNPKSDTLNYFIASAYLATGETKTAIPYFEKVLLQTNSEFLNDTHWYLGLALIKEDRLEEGIKQIERAERPEKSTLLKQIQ